MKKNHQSVTKWCKTPKNSCHAQRRSCTIIKTYIFSNTKQNKQKDVNSVNKKSISLQDKTCDSLRQIMKPNMLIKKVVENENGKMFMKCGTDGAFPVGIKAWKHWLEFREITLYHYNLSISSEMAVCWHNKFCFLKLSSYCVIAQAMI